MDPRFDMKARPAGKALFPMKALPAFVCVLALALGACTSGAAVRGTTSVAVKSALKANNVDYRGDVTCRGTELPVTCTSTATDGRPIVATLTKSDGDCVLAVTVGGSQISRNKAACP